MKKAADGKMGGRSSGLIQPILWLRCRRWLSMNDDGVRRLKPGLPAWREYVPLHIGSVGGGFVRKGRIIRGLEKYRDFLGISRLGRREGTKARRHEGYYTEARRHIGTKARGAYKS